MSQPGPSNNAPYSKSELERVIRTIANMSYLFRDSSTLKSTGAGRNQKMMSTLHSYAGMIGYLYQYTYKMGEYSALVDNDMNIHFALVTVAMNDSYNRNRSIKQLAENWSDVLQSVLYLQVDGTTEGNKMKAMQSDIDFVTKVFETLSGSKCRKPVNQMTERFSQMVENATFNPFKVTNNPRLQNNPPLPPEFFDVFKREINNLLSNPAARQMGVKEILKGYVFNMVESYYNNAHYVPKTTVDAIIEMCYNAVKQSQYGNTIGSLDDIKYEVYYGFLNK